MVLVIIIVSNPGVSELNALTNNSMQIKGVITQLITILQAADHSVTEGYSSYKSAEQFNLTKMFMPNGSVRSYDKATYFQLHESYRFDGLAELYPKLANWSKMSNVLMVRSHLEHEIKENQKIKRNSSTFNVRWKSSLLTVDIDTLALPNRINSLDIKKQGQHVCSVLHKLDPEGFPKGIGFIAQASSSAAYNTDKIKLHLFFHVSREYSQTQYKNYLKGLNNKYKETTGEDIELLDMSIYSAAQALYICNPVFVNYKQDPFLGKNRIAYEPSKRKMLVQLPDPSTIQDAVEVVTMTDKQLDKVISLQSGSPYINDFLQVAIDEVADPNKSTRTIVQKCFHRAYQAGFSLDKLTDILRPMIKKVRPTLPQFSANKSEDSIDSYLFEGRKVCMEKIHTNIHRELPNSHDSTPIVEIKSQAWPEDSPLTGKLNLPEPPEENSITFIKASLGSGKTYNVKQWMNKQLKGDTLLAITDTIALVEANCSEFDGFSFNSSSHRSREYIQAYKESDSVLTDIKKLDSWKNVNVLSGTIQSVKKLEGCTRYFDTIFIDEADAVLNTILTSPTMGSLETLQEDRAKTIEVLKDLIANAKRVILCDGDFDGTTVNAWLSLFGTKKHVFKVNHCAPIMQKHKAYVHKSTSSLWNQAYEDIIAGRRCLIVTDWGPKQLYPKKIYIEKLGKNVAAIHKDSKIDRINTKILKNTRREYSPEHGEQLSCGLVASKLDVVLCSPSVTSGVDWHYFDSVFIINEHLNSTPSLRFQASRRCRRALEYHYYCKDSGYFQNGFEGENCEILDDNERHFRVELYKRESKEMNQYAANYRQYFLNQECPVRFYENHNAPDPILMAEAKEEAMQDHCDAIMRVKSADKEDMPEGYNSAWEDKELILAFYEITAEDLTDDIVMYFLKQEYKIKAEFLDKLAQHYSRELLDCVKYKSVKPLLDLMKVKSGEFRHNTGEFPERKEKKVKAMLKRCGLELDYETDYEEHIKEQLKFYELYIKVDRYKKVPEILNAELYGEKQEIRDM